MTRSAVAACVLVLALAGCATARNSGTAVATLADDGSIRLQTRKPGLFGDRAGETVVFRPGEPGYAAMKTQIEALDAGPRRPVLSWTFGEPELTLPAGR